MNEYEQQANEFLKDTKTEFKAEFLKNSFHFSGDTEKRNIYEITLKRGEREYKFKFGDSIANTENLKKSVSAYSVLSCLTKNEVGDFNNFCDDFGYDTDSRTAEKTYKAVLEEWNNVKMLFTDAEIEKLQEIN